MSAHMVSFAHIDALLTAGLDRSVGPACSRLRWLWLPVEVDESGAYRRGAVSGPEAFKLYEQKVHELTRETVDAVGQMLLAQNAVSVGHRYDEEVVVGEYEWRRYLHPYTGERSGSTFRRPLQPVEVLSLIAGYEYQACEDPGWEHSQAHAFCQALKDQQIRALRGYSEAPWSVDERTPAGTGPIPLSELARRRS